jgi:two-component system chemotaxis response regulator CheY
MDLSTKTILICDDSILARKQLMDTIKALNTNVNFLEGKNGQEAVDLYKEHKPDLVFLDIVMPLKDGTTAVKEIMEFDSSAVIIIVSSVGTQLQLKSAIESGAKDFVQKPIDAEQIQKLVSKQLGGI